MNNPTSRLIEKYNLKVALILAVVGLLVGSVFGMSLHSSHKATAAPVATTKAVVAAPAPVIKTVTKEVTKVPQYCLDALDNSDAGFTQAAKLTAQFQKVIKAVSNYDYSGISKANKKIKSINAELNDVGIQYVYNKSMCRDAAN